AAADLGRVHSERAGGHVYDPLAHEVRLVTAGGSVRTGRRLVGHRAGDLGPVVRNAIGAWQIAGRIVGHGGAVGAYVGAQVAPKPVVHPEDRAVAADGEGDLVVLLA